MEMKLSPKLEEWRIKDGMFRSPSGVNWGQFLVPGPCGEKLLIVASDGLDSKVMDKWEHVSVSTRKRLPNWREMCFVKDLFWDAEECVIQFHPKKSDCISNWEVLHLWRPVDGKFPIPPSILVGIKELGELTL